VKDRLYIIGTNGTGVVVKHGEQFEVLAQNQLNDRFFASPVAVENELILRGEKFLYCISE
jgi:hypothetical protein